MQDCIVHVRMMTDDFVLDSDSDAGNALSSHDRVSDSDSDVTSATIYDDHG